MSRIWVTVITGFLGSGKTTLLNRLLDHPDMSRAAVIVNEFGEIGIDYDLVSRSDDSIVQLENGCLCCTVKGDLIDTFRDLHIQRAAGNLPKFERVIIETTGIADPAPVLQIILTNPMVVNHYALDGVVTTVDAINGISSLDRFAECIKQVAIADRIILTKIDLVSGPDREKKIAQLRDRLRKLNPAAPIIETTTSNVEPSQLFGTGLFDPDTKSADLAAWLQADAYQNNPPTDEGGAVLAASAEPDADTLSYYRAHGHAAPTVHAHDPDIKSFCLVREDPVTLDMLRLFLEALTREAGPDLLRVKGIVHVRERPDRPAVIQGAQQIFHSLDWLDAWPSEDRRTRIVFITRAIDQEYIENTFDLIERIAERTVRAAEGALPPEFPA